MDNIKKRTGNIIKNLDAYFNVAAEQKRRYYSDDWRDCDIQKRMICVCCGKPKISKSILRFYGDDVRKVKCYDCQKRIINN